MLTWERKSAHTAVCVDQESGRALQVAVLGPYLGQPGGPIYRVTGPGYGEHTDHASEQDAAATVEAWLLRPVSSEADS